MNHFELLDATLRYVIGACYKWENDAKQFVGRPNDFRSFYLRTHDVCWKYLNGQKTLDGSCSDFECDTAIKMRRVFRSFVNNSL